MSTRKFSLQVTTYGDASYGVAIIQQTWDASGVRREKPVVRRFVERWELEDFVLAALAGVISLERGESDASGLAELRSTRVGESPRRAL